MKRKSNLIYIVLSLIVVAACGNNSDTVWEHFNVTLPGKIQSLSYGNREYWIKGNEVVFTKPAGTIVEKEMNRNIAEKFSENDPRKLLSKTDCLITYGLDDKNYSYTEANTIRGYKPLQEVSEEPGSETNHIFVKNDEMPAVYARLLTATGLIDTDDAFNEKLWAFDHDITGYYVIANDINFIKTKTVNSVTTQTTYHFLGTLDGRYHTIDTVKVSNNSLGMFGGTLASKNIGGQKYSPKFVNLMIDNVSGQNRIFGDSMSDTSLTQCFISQGDNKEESYFTGLLANYLGSNNVIKKCTFNIGELVAYPSLFATSNGSNNTFSGTNIKFTNSFSRVVADNPDTGVNGSIPGINWKSLGVISVNNLNGKAIDAVGEEPLQYLSLVDNPSTKTDEIAQYLYSRQTHSGNSAKPVTISWNATSEAVYPLTITLAKNRDLTDTVKIITIPTSEIKLYNFYNLIPGDYYYQISDNAATPHKSIVDSFSYATHLRVMNVSGIPNMRDLGGWVGENGKSIKYGLVYRSATWQNLDSIGANVLENELSVKNEIDLRFNSSTKSYDSREHPYSQFGFIHNGLIDAYENMFTHAETISNIYNLFTILSNVNNYPLVYHCSAGADRTGLCSLLIEGALGLSDQDIYRDYELTTFYYTNRVRADIKIDDQGNYYFREDGGRSDFWHENGFKQLLETNLKSYYTASGKVCDAITNFLITKCKVTQETLNNVKDILLNS